MEAAAVAQGAEARGVEFGALKAISDGRRFQFACDRSVYRRRRDFPFRQVCVSCGAASMAVEDYHHIGAEQLQGKPGSVRRDFELPGS